MKQKAILFTMIALVAMSLPAMSARVVNKPIPHSPFLVYQAYCGGICGTTSNGGSVIKAVPGVLAIDPGGTQPLNGWPNFVSASGDAGLDWTVTNVSLRKTVPTYTCTIPIGGAAVLQQGSDNIRLWWPLMYELPGTKWTLTVTYKTAVWDDDGAGPNLAATTHQDVWEWEVRATLSSMANLVDLFHQLPAGNCAVALINGTDLYKQIQTTIATLKTMDPIDPETAEVFNSFLLLIEDSCLTVDCGSCSTDLGIRNTVENPACCKLLADAEYVLANAATDLNPPPPPSPY